MNGRRKAIRRDDLVEHLDLLVFLEERLAPLGVAEVLDEVVDVPIVKVVLDQARIETEALASPSCF
jgi:hypothetical protein